jgi:hypothetical protein
MILSYIKSKICNLRTLAGYDHAGISTFLKVCGRANHDWESSRRELDT